MTPDLPTVLYDGNIRVTSTRSGGLLVATAGCGGNLLLTSGEAHELYRALSLRYAAVDAAEHAVPATPEKPATRSGGARRRI